MLCCVKCRKVIEREKYVEKNGTKICLSCVSFEKISKALFGEKVEKEVIAKCNRNNCSNLIYNTDPPRKFLKNSGFEYIFSSSESEEIILCEKCYQERINYQKKQAKIFKWAWVVLSFCVIVALVLWFLLFYQDKVKVVEELWSKHPVKIIFLVILVVVIILILCLFYALKKRLKCWEENKKVK